LFSKRLNIVGSLGSFVGVALQLGHINSDIGFRRELTRCHFFLSKQTNDTHIVYTNSIKYDYTVIENQIVRVNTYRIEVSCEFPRDIDVDKGVTPVTETVTQKAAGSYIITMKFYNDSFNTALNGPIQMTLGEWFFRYINFNIYFQHNLQK
jgi:hypothetical protein